MSDTPQADTQERIYLGNAQEKTRKDSTKFLVGSLCLDDIEAIDEKHITYANNKKRYVKVLISPLRNGPNDYGSTHSISVDTYKKSPPEETSR